MDLTQSSKLFFYLFLILVVEIERTNSENGTLSHNPAAENSPQKAFLKKAGEFASRMVWMVTESDKHPHYGFPPRRKRKFVLPKGTLLSIAPKITVPVFRHKPLNGGLNSDVQASWYFYMDFDKLEMTSENHPWPFDMPPFYPFGSHMRPRPLSKEKDAENDKDKDNKNSQSHPEHKPFPNIQIVEEGYRDSRTPFGTLPKEFKGYPESHHRRPRSVMSLPPPESVHGGERAIIMPSIEGLMSNFGFEGRACLLRAICEIHEFPLGTNGFGVFGEMLTLFFSVSQSPYAETHMPEYLKSELNGKKGDCSMYYQNCTKSIFSWEPAKINAEDMANLI